MRKNLLTLAAVAIAATLTLSACSGGASSSSNTKEQTQQNADSAAFLTAQPVPHFDWSQIRQTLIDVEGAQAHTIQTTSFFFMMGMDHPYLICNSVGFPVASTTELTNPQQVEHHSSDGGGNAVINQPDPTGVYSGNSAGTYVLCINQNGQAEMQYAEPDVHTVAGQAAWDTKTGTIVFTGNPTGDFKVGK